MKPTAEQRLAQIEQALLQLNVAVTCIAGYVKQQPPEPADLSHLLRCASAANQRASEILHRER